MTMVGWVIGLINRERTANEIHSRMDNGLHHGIGNVARDRGTHLSHIYEAK